MRKRLLAAGVAAAIVAAATFGWLWQRAYGPWPQWQAFCRHFVQSDGRVVDRTAGGRSTSEAQAYALFFALVAGDRLRFDSILNWTRDNLCEGDFAKRLPAWLWGRRSDGSWGVVDDNPASDADLWLAYALFEAGRLWQAPQYTELGRLLLRQVKAQEVAQVAGVGPLLLPGPQGFRLEGGRWRLNPSYYARFQLVYFAGVDPEGPWRRVWKNWSGLQGALYGARELAPDWFVIDAQGRPQPDTQRPGVGSYDAIRVYLWAGMSAHLGLEELDRLGGLRDVIRQHGGVPEFVDVASGAASGGQPLGFSGAVLPYLKALGEDTQASLQQKRLRENRIDGSLGDPAHYYDQVLPLFGEAWVEKRYRFGVNGALRLRWESLCCV